MSTAKSGTGQPTPPPPAAPNNPPPPASPPQAKDRRHNELIIYSHSTLFYWWPVWLVGYVLALITYLDGQSHVIEPGGAAELFHRSSSLGVIYFLTIFRAVLITNSPVRGLAAGMVITTLIALTVLFAYLGWWDDVLGFFGSLRIHLNLGAYFWFSTLMLILWVLTVFVLDRMSYWRVRPGQVTRVAVVGGGSRSYDTDNMVLEKYRDDLFRHWILGFGSGDLRIQPYGAGREEMVLHNVLFIDWKVPAFQRMMAVEPQVDAG